MDHASIQWGSIAPFFSVRKALSALLVLFIPLVTACGNEGTSQAKKEARTNERETSPTRFELDKEAYGYRLRTLTERSEGNGQLYHLIKKGQKAPETGQDAIQLRIPLERIACMSSTHVGMLLALEEAGRIAAFSSKDHLYDQDIRERMEAGGIEAIGMQRSVNTEKLVSIKVDLLLDNGMGKGTNGEDKIRRKAGIPSIDILAWKEADPIARLKWLRVFGALTGKKAKADSLIEHRKSRYDSIASLIDGRERNPEVLCNAPHKGTWHIPGGESYMTGMIRDAGGKQPWPEDEATGGVPKSLEEVIAKGGDANIWLNPGQADDLEGLLSMDKRISRIEAFQKREVYKNDRRKIEGGGNDHWESGIVHPEIILADLAQIFQPDLFPNRELCYYRELPMKQSR